MEANPPGADPAGPARIFSYIDGEVLTDFYCAVDIVDWNDSINQAFGILGRVGNIALGKTTGYVCNYDPSIPFYDQSCPPQGRSLLTIPAETSSE